MCMNSVTHYWIDRNCTWPESKSSYFSWNYTNINKGDVDNVQTNQKRSHIFQSKEANQTNNSSKEEKTAAPQRWPRDEGEIRSFVAHTKAITISSIK